MNAPLATAQDAIKCACRSASARECIVIRYNTDLDDDIEERCECVCHELEDLGDE